MYYMWHDIKKYPNDLPAEDKRVLIAFKIWKSHLSYKVAQLSNGECFYPDGNSRIELENVYAWKEIEEFIPEYEEETNCRL